MGEVSREKNKIGLLGCSFYFVLLVVSLLGYLEGKVLESIRKGSQLAQ